LIISIADDERYAYTSESEPAKIAKNVKKSVKDLLAFGFDPDHTFVYVNTEYIDVLYRNVGHI